MDGSKRLRTVFDVKTYGVHDGPGAARRHSDRRLVVRVGMEWLGRETATTLSWMRGGDSNGVPGFARISNDATPEKSRPAKKEWDARHRITNTNTKEKHPDKPASRSRT
jgi:hypothetical protein